MTPEQTTADSVAADFMQQLTDMGASLTEITDVISSLKGLAAAKVEAEIRQLLDLKNSLK